MAVVKNGTNGNDVINITTELTGVNFLYGYGGDDSIFGSGAGDYVSGGDGDDYIIGFQKSKRKTFA